MFVPNYRAVTSLNSITHGDTAALANWEAMFAGDTAEYYVRTTRTVQANDTWGQAEELGDWEGERMQRGDRVRVSGTYAAKWVQRDDRWMLQAEVFTLLSCEGSETACTP